jgi:hypothetical protein
VKWAGSRDKIFSPSGRGRTFFLTSLFIELIDASRARNATTRLLLQAFDHVKIGEGADVAVDVGLSIRCNCNSTDGIDARGVRRL